jgi:hypothetical protein
MTVKSFYINKISIGGETGIRTLGTFARTTVFETAPFNHSGTSPTPIGRFYRILWAPGKVA